MPSIKIISGSILRSILNQSKQPKVLKCINNWRTMSTIDNLTLTMDNMNPNLKDMDHVVIGPLIKRAEEIENELQKGAQKTFTEILNANIGNCHALGQIPITFVRQVLSLVTHPKLMESPDFPEDVKERARIILSGCRGGSIGSYTEASGIEIIRRHIAKYIEERDGGIPSDWQNIIIGSGASDAIKKVLRLFDCPVNGKVTGIMIPIPQYPLFSSTAGEFGMHQIGYYLDESRNWSLDISELERAIADGKKQSHPRILVVINPGNPTGQVLPRENIENIIKFAYKENLYIIADEVYQQNIYAQGSKFFSFKKVLTEMGDPYSNMQLASFMSCSKGYMGECGLRAGYAEVLNMCPKVRTMYLKSISAMLCPTVFGQACLDTLANPPVIGEPSYDLWLKEKNDILNSLKLKAEMAEKTFNSMERMECNKVQGAVYAFPRINLPIKAIEAAKEAGLEPDNFYVTELLEHTGISVLPGSVFGQKPGTYHFRTTILLPQEKHKIMIEKLSVFHSQFIKKYS